MIWLTALGWLNKARVALWGLVRTYPWQTACAVLLGLFLGAEHGKHTAQEELAAMKRASVEAGKAQAAVNHAPAAKSQAIAEKSNADAQDYYAKGRAAGLAYADAHRVPRPCPASHAAVPGTDHAAPVNDGPGDTPAEIAVSQADFDQLVANSLRLAKVQQDAQALIDAGVAIKSTEPNTLPKEAH